MHVVIFEGNQWGTFAPLSLSRPVFTLVTGLSTLLEKQVRHLKPSRVTLWVRPELVGHCCTRIGPKLGVPCAVNQPLDDEPALLVSGRTLHLRRHEPLPLNTVILDEPDIIRQAHVKAPGLGPDDVLKRTPRWQELHRLARVEPQARMVHTLWDLIHFNEESLVEDSAHFRQFAGGKAPAHASLMEPDNVYIWPKAQIGPGAVLDASAGPVFVGEGARVGSNAVLEGPCCVGPWSTVLPLSHLRGGVTIGACCTVAGEISNSIILGHTNKLHAGFIGDSYLGKWITLGPGTVVNNTRLNLAEISVQLGTRRVPTGRRALGLVMGDHCHTAGNSSFLPGSYCGFCSVVRVAGHAPRFVPSFGFLTEQGLEPYDMAKAIAVTRDIYRMRDRTFLPEDEAVMRYVASSAANVEYG